MSRPLELLIASAQRSEHCALVTLVGIHGAAPRRIGAQMAVSATGEVAGSFSGGCLDAAVIEEAQRAFADSVSRRVRYGADSPYVDIVLPCGSGLDLQFDGAMPAATINAIAQAFARREAFDLRWRDPAQPPDGLSPATASNKGDTRIQHFPALRMVLAGAGAAAGTTARARCTGVGTDTPAQPAGPPAARARPAGVGSLDAGRSHADLSCALSSGTDGSRMTTVIAIIAAGDSTRLGQPKQLVQWRGRSLLQRAIDTACEVAPRVLVTLGAYGDALWGTLHLPPTLERINVADHRDGLSASLRAAVSHLDPDTAVERLLVMLVDQYAIDAVWLRHLLKLAGAHPQRIVASRYAGVRGVPAVFPRNALTALAALQGDAGARAMLRDECDPVDHIAPHPPGDVDTPAQISPS
jgi:CTP:molybdopterin cytidylyltransferase MocA